MEAIRKELVRTTTYCLMLLAADATNGIFTPHLIYSADYDSCFSGENFSRF